MVYLTRIESFNAAHKLWVNDWSDDKNFQVFGKCANRNWHGHNYKLHVTVKGEPDPVTGFIIDVKELSNIIHVQVLEYLDHRNLNLDVEFFPKDMMPTTENVAMQIWKRLQGNIPNGKLHRIKLYETDKICAEYFGE